MGKSGKDDEMRERDKKGQGFTLVEVVLSIAILALVAGPFITFIGRSLANNERIQVRTGLIFAGQGLLEDSLLQQTVTASAGQFMPLPRWPGHEYRIEAVPVIGNSLKEITMEIRKTDQPQQVMSLVTMKARRKYDELAAR